MQRGNFEMVPGCHGEELNQKDDFCFSPANYLWIMGNGGDPASAFPLNVCEGDCDNDSDCADGLMCFERAGSEAVPGCDGPGTDGKDYCYYPGSPPTGSPNVSIGKVCPIMKSCFHSLNSHLIFVFSIQILLTNSPTPKPAPTPTTVRTDFA